MQQPPYGPPPYGPPPQGYGYPPQPPGKQPMSGAAIALIVVAGVFLVSVGTCAGTCVLVSRGAKKAAEEKRAAFASKTAEKVTAAEIASVYKANEVRGDERFKGKKLEVTGKIDGIDSGIGDTPVIRLQGADMFQDVMVNDVPRAAAAKLEKGQTITVVCRGDGEIIGMPRLDECELK